MTQQERQLKIRSLLARLDALEGGPVGKEVNELLSDEANRAIDLIKNSPTAKAVGLLSKELAKVKADPRIPNLEEGIGNVSRETDTKLSELAGAFGESLTMLQQQMQESEGRGQEFSVNAMRSVLENLSSLSERFDLEYAVLDEQGKRALQEVGNTRQEIATSLAPFSAKDKELEKAIDSTGKVIEQTNVRVTGVEETIKKIAEDLDSRIKKVQTAVNNGNGNMNRNIAVGGNTSVLSKWTDVNLKPGSNVNITYTPNDATGYTDITFSATGGGGGTSRSVNNINTSQTADGTASTDFVYICSAGIRLTMPTASSNNNLYTIKNTSNSSILVSPDGADTLDSDTSIILATKYTSVDLISDGVSNWNIT